MGGRLYWVTGLSGAGKTTIGSLLYKHLKEKYPNTVIFDGDALRQAFGNDLGYSAEDRFQCAMRYARLCKLLAEQDIHVVCCTISMFNQVREWNRRNIENYSEIYIEVPLPVLEKRNQKNLYQDVKDGIRGNVVGMDLELQLPEKPDIRLVNDGKKTPEEMCRILLEELGDAIS
ncbi:MAG: adenylyl-sulfate kinase [Lachnospiraceae bacterium]|jgi:adenylylsulfate kinase-like enzyme|nr:adenylyl-sulfate kinase [Lachnospiraceae bacterium]